MKKILCSKMSACFMVLFFTSGILQAQTPQYSTSGTGSTNNIPYNSATSNKAQYIYTPTQFSASAISGYITSVYVKSGTAINNITYTDLTVKLGYTSLSAFASTNFVTGLVTYYSVPSRVISTTNGGWVKFTLATPFYYDGVQKLIFEGSHTGYSGTGFAIIHSSNSGNLRLSGNVSSTTGSISASQVNFGFDLAPALPCTSPPTPGTVTSTYNPVCGFINNFTLGLSGTSVGLNQTYQWQSSPDSITWTDINGATDISWQTNQMATTYYRCRITCGANTVPTPGLKVLSTPLVSGTYTIDKSLPTGSGNFQSFNDAVNFMKCGINGPVVFNVVPVASSGTYNEQVTIEEIAGSSAANTITFNGNGANLSFSSSNTNSRALITLDGAKHIKIDNLVMDVSAGTYGWGVMFIRSADSNKVSNCIINSSLTNSSIGNHIPIIFTGSFTSSTGVGNNGSYDTIVGNTLNGGYYGVSLNGNSAAGAQNIGNVISNNKINEVYIIGIYMTYQANAWIHKNEISRPARFLSGAPLVGIYVHHACLGTLVEKNRIYNMFGGSTTTTTIFQGIYLSTAAIATVSQPNRLINNLIYNIGGNGPVYGIYNSASANMQAYHNTISLDGQVAADAATYGFYQTGSAANIDFRNNLVSISRSGSGIKRAIHFATTGSTLISNSNVLFMNATSGFDNNIGQYGSTSYLTLADWKTANGGAFDQQSISVDPLFVNAGGGDYTPGDASINGLGTDLGITTDILDNPRGINPDPGAYEFTPVGLDGALTWVAPVQGSISSGLKTITVNLSNFSLTLPITSANISYTNGLNLVTQNFTGLNIAPGTSQNLSFSTQYNMVASTKMQAFINLINNTSDIVQTNDTTAWQNFCLPFSGTYTINSALSTGGTNYQSYTEAVEQLACAGVTGPTIFNVQPGSGPYNEQVVIPQIAGASATKTITFNGNGTSLIFNSVTANKMAGITLDGADHIKIDSLIIDGSGGTYNWGVLLTNQADSNRISRCIINTDNSSSTTNFGGIAITGSLTSVTTAGNNGNYDTITDNTINGGYYGIVLNGNSTADGQNVGNAISNNSINEMYSYGIYLVNQSGTWVSKNDISRLTRSNSGATAGVFASTGCLGLLIEKNRIHNLFDALPASTSVSYGIYLATGTSATAAKPNRLINNLVYNIGGNGAVYGINNTGSAFMQAYHNTISLNSQTVSSGVTYGFYQTGAASDIDVRNNLVFVSRASTGNKRCLYFSTTASGITSNRNVLYLDTTVGTNNNLGQYGSTNYFKLANWKTAGSNKFDQQSISEDPIFQNAAGGNYLPTADIVNNRGTSLSILTDILGIARHAISPDAGAYEFGMLTAGLNMSTEDLAIPDGSSKGCYGNAETISIRIRNVGSATINFATNPATVTTNVSGAVTQTLTAIINSGTLASDSTMNVQMSQLLNMTTNGVYTFNANTTVGGDVNTINDTMLAVTRTKVALTAGTANVTYGEYCAQAPLKPILATNGVNGYASFKWVQSSVSGLGYVDVAGANTSPYEIASPFTQTMYYKMVASCGSANDSSNQVIVNYNNPAIVSTTPATRCGTGSVTLQGAGSAGTTLNWYGMATGGNKIGSGNSFATPSISSTTDYWVSASTSASSTGATPFSAQTSTQNNTARGYWFTAPFDFTISGVRDLGTSGGAQSIAIVRFNPSATIPNFSATTNDFTTLYLTQENAANGVLPVNIKVYAGDVIGVLGQRGIGTAAISSYSTPNPYTTTINGQPVSLKLLGMQQAIATYLPNNLFQSPTTTSVGRVELSYEVLCESPRTSVTATVDSCPLPITLVNFTGEKQGSTNKLQWTTSTEVSNAGFELERSADGRNFSKLVFVDSKGDNGNSNTNLDYVYNDERPLASNSYYRLKQVDKDGKFTYSNIIIIKGSKVKDISITSLYPNPADKEINLVISSPTSDKVTLVVTDMTGKIISQTAMQVSIGDNLQKLPVNQLASGTYLIKTICANGCESAVQKFVKR